MTGKLTPIVVFGRMAACSWRMRRLVHAVTFLVGCAVAFNSCGGESTAEQNSTNLLFFEPTDDLWSACGKKGKISCKYISQKCLWKTETIDGNETSNCIPHCQKFSKSACEESVNGCFWHKEAQACRLSDCEIFTQSQCVANAKVCLWVEMEEEDAKKEIRKMVKDNGFEERTGKKSSFKTFFQQHFEWHLDYVGIPSLSFTQDKLKSEIINETYAYRNEIDREKLAEKLARKSKFTENSVTDMIADKALTDKTDSNKDKKSLIKEQIDLFFNSYTPRIGFGDCSFIDSKTRTLARRQK